ncbi:HD domain-containing phosphohydrolase [Pseudodesulfovibrio sp. zrk46]|uniref:HD-GYP domain-containing protein n=1 Tax=Pseudodesulfovibrio sp. zrk46 TaxID=2725288 RepID=UPI001448C616|nr:HD domain-containing phosphohydrolase [Pseudodesulfovibrio sp. zrk46]QJB55082.1 HD domain-containing protein [Pseudodesulfovibrio sp. zrk46]
MALAQESEYIPVSPRVLRPDSKGAFDLFLRRGDTFVLFNAAGRMFTNEKREELLGDNAATLYIESADLRDYNDYLKANITEVLDDENIPVDERAKTWANTAKAMGQELFEKKLPGPAFAKRYKRFERLIQSTTNFLQSPKSLKHLSRFIGNGFDDYQHGLGTMVYTVCLMQEYDYDDHKLSACGMGALLHDIGKSGLPKAVLEKNPDDLTDDERSLLELHPMIGARTCANFNLPTIGSNCILFHHERADGTGYPTSAASDEVPLHTKIVSLCNVYDNLTRNRPGKDAVTPFEALKRIMDDDGLVDKDILKKFVKMLSQAEVV